MVNIEKRQIIDRSKLSGESYFTSILQEANACGLMTDLDLENIQMQCIEFLAYKSERYNCGDSSSIRVEVAENIMKSNLYTVGLFLKTLPDADSAVGVLKATSISELYKKGRLLIGDKKQATKRLYEMVITNKIVTPNYTYNATLDELGIGSFFKQYDADYAAHEIPASIDYQLCNPVTDLTGIEFIQKYLENIVLENEFCNNFAAEDIHHLLCGYDEGYGDLLINIFEYVLTAAVGCMLANCSVTKLDITAEQIKCVNSELSKDDDYSIAIKIRNATEKVLQELNITNALLCRYIGISLSKVTFNIIRAIKTNSLGKVFVSPINPDLKSKIQFLFGAKMDDEDYRELINELLTCRHSSDKLEVIKEKVKSFGDIEDVLLDAMLNKKEVVSVFDIFGNAEIAALIKRHPYNSGIQAVDLSESEQALRLYLKTYVDELPTDRQEQVFNMVKHLHIDSF